MNLKRTVAKLALVSILLMTFIIFMGAAQPYVSTKSAYVDEHWFDIIIDAASYQIALLEHEIDMGGVGLPEYMDPLEDAGFTLTSTQRLGYTFFMTNNRRWPVGGYSFDDPIYGPSGYGTPTEPWAGEASYFRKGLNRLIDMDYIVGELYAPLMSECEYYLPPGAAYWINPAAPGPEYNPGTTNDMFPLVTGSAYLNEGGFLPGDDDNTYADADETADYYSAKLRVDPRTGNTLDEVEYYAIGPVESPIGYEAARVITAACHTAGVPIRLVAGTWLGMVTKLVNGIWNDYQIMTGVGIVWGSPAPDILYDFTYSENLPLWNFVAQNSTAADAAGIRMMSTLDLAECRQAAFDIQTYLSDYESYKPFLLWEDYFAETGPYEDEPGLIGIVNFVGRNPHSSSNIWGKMLTRAGRDHPTSTGLEINKWGLGAYLDTLNPLTADTVPDWQIQTRQRYMLLLLELLATVVPQIKIYEKELSRLLDEHPDAFIFRSLPNAGDVTAAWLLGEIGDCRDNFEAASAMQALAGTCPVTVQSNKRRQIKFRFGCCKSFRNAMQQFARLSARGIRGSSWAKGYLSDQLARGHSVSRATRALANRWLAIIFRLWQDRVVYDEEIHLRNRAQRGRRVLA